jgi:hypothetical protein
MTSEQAHQAAHEEYMKTPLPIYFITPLLCGSARMKTDAQLDLYLKSRHCGPFLGLLRESSLDEMYEFYHFVFSQPMYSTVDSILRELDNVIMT